MAGMTMTEKILAKHSGKTRVAAGENVWVNVDVLMTHDVCGPGTIGIFHEKFGRNAKVWDFRRCTARHFASGPTNNGFRRFWSHHGWLGSVPFEAV